MSELPTPAGMQPETINPAHLTPAPNAVRQKLGRLSATMLLIAGGGVLASGAEDVISATPAHADTVYGTLGYPWANAPCEFGASGGASCTNPSNSEDAFDWGEYVNNTFEPYRNGGYEYRNCTDYVAWRVADLGGSIPNTLGNAKNWPSEFSSSDVSTSPIPGDIAVSTSGYFGHVAFVEAVSGNSMTVSEYNYDEEGDGDERTLPTSGSEFTEFINVGIGSTSGGGTGSTPNIPLVGDVTGDGKADAVIVNPDIVGKAADSANSIDALFHVRLHHH